MPNSDKRKEMECLFGEMRYLTPEENEQKINMYRKMSTIVEGISFSECERREGKFNSPY